LRVLLAIARRGASWTAARNAPGSFALFGGSAWVKESVFKLEKYSDATFMQDSLASVAGTYNHATSDCLTGR
jgi:hypothetical protein